MIRILLFATAIGGVSSLAHFCGWSLEQTSVTDVTHQGRYGRYVCWAFAGEVGNRVGEEETRVSENRAGGSEDLYGRPDMHSYWATPRLQRIPIKFFYLFTYLLIHLRPFPGGKLIVSIIRPVLNEPGGMVRA